MAKRPSTGWDGEQFDSKRPRERFDSKLPREKIESKPSSSGVRTKAELQTALTLRSNSFKEQREIAKELEKFTPMGREGEIDLSVQLADLGMKKYPHAQIFVCYRCDHVKTSNMKAKFRGSQAICGSCFDHLTRCVIPFRELPEHQRPARCMHQVPKTYQKQFR